MNVATILREKGRSIVTSTAGASIRSIAQKLAELKIGALVIVDDEGGLEGIVSERDIIRAIARDDESCLAQSVSTIMTRNVVTCTKHDTVATVMGVMTAGRFRHMPVMDDGKLIGIISIGDVVKNHIAEVEMEASALKTYLAAG